MYKDLINHLNRAHPKTNNHIKLAPTKTFALEFYKKHHHLKRHRRKTKRSKSAPLLFRPNSLQSEDEGSEVGDILESVGEGIANRMPEPQRTRPSKSL